MLAARAHKGEQRLRLEQVEIPAIDENEVLIRTRASGINRGTLGLWRQSGRMSELPTTLSYEIAGEIAALGTAVRDLAIGDRVMAHTLLSCGKCDYCIAGEDADCPAAANMGHVCYGEAGLPLYRRYHHGGLAEYVRVPAASIERLPARVSYEAAAKIVSFGVAYRSLSRLNIKPGAALAINGISGAFGAAAAMLAPLFGVGRIVGVARADASLTRIRPLLAEVSDYVTLEALGPDWEASGALARKLLGLSDAAGFDGALDFTPAGAAVTVQMLGALRKGGTMVITGGNHEHLALPSYAFLMANSLTIRGSRGSGRNITRALLKLAAAGRIDCERLISHHYTLAQINDAVAAIDGRDEKPLLISVLPDV
jgi:threonine dehydrogenase-like Zn-dependent dehydrogenase